MRGSAGPSSRGRARAMAARRRPSSRGGPTVTAPSLPRTERMTRRRPRAPRTATSTWCASTAPVAAP
eukprot:1396496-Alexandrium_andersonii.AAC.1